MGQRNIDIQMGKWIIIVIICKSWNFHMISPHTLHFFVSFIYTVSSVWLILILSVILLVSTCSRTRWKHVFLPFSLAVRYVSKCFRPSFPRVSVTKVGISIWQEKEENEMWNVIYIIEVKSKTKINYHKLALLLKTQHYTPLNKYQLPSTVEIILSNLVYYKTCNIASHVIRSTWLEHKCYTHWS